MPIFSYIGITPAGDRVCGEIHAPSRSDAVGSLRKQKVRLSSIRPRSLHIELHLHSRSAPRQSLTRFTRQFAAMTSAGLPLVQCMDTLARQSENQFLARAARQVSNDITSGVGLADALRRQKRAFDDLYCNMVAAGETSGNLAGVLLRLAEHQEKSGTLRRKIRGAMTYPLVLFSVAIAATAVLLAYVVPSFADMFAQMGAELPSATRAVLSASEFLKHFGLAILGGAAAALLLLSRVAKTPRARHALDSLRLKLPVWGDLEKKASISRFSHTLETLLVSGVDIIEALSTTARTAGNSVVEKALRTTIDRISTGETLAEPLRRTGLFPPMVTDMIAVGEATGDLPGMLGKISGFYREEVDSTIETVTSVIEPVMVVVMGAIFGLILYAMYLPMFDIINTIS